MRRTRIHISLLATVFFLVFTLVLPLWQAGCQEIRYIFYCIGDGMGFPQVEATETYLQSRGESLTMTSFPVHGKVTTHSLDSAATDSAAAATALATGYKAASGVLSMNLESREPYQTVAEFARDAGMKVGILTTVAMNDATPAAFYAHQTSRRLHYQIGLDLIESGFDLFAGWGIASRHGPKGTSPDLLELAYQAGYTVVRDIAELTPTEIHTDKAVALLPLHFELDREGHTVSLAQLTEAAIRFLSHPQGFFLMVEGGKIDWACHVNDPGTTITEMHAFDEAVAVASAFADRFPEETLIVVTGDHETGGMSLEEFFSPERVSLLEQQKVSYQRFLDMFEEESPATVEEVLLFVSRTHGFVLDNHDHPLYLEEHERDALGEILYLLQNGDQEVIRKRFAGYHPLMITANHILSRKAGISWSHHGHGTEPVPVYARGVKAELFNEARDNTDIAKILFNILGSVEKSYHWEEGIPIYGTDLD